jgi:hypothetical protein
MGKAEEDPLLPAAKAKLGAYVEPKKGKGQPAAATWQEMLGPLFTAILCFPMLLAH